MRPRREHGPRRSRGAASDRGARVRAACRLCRRRRGCSPGERGTHRRTRGARTHHRGGGPDRARGDHLAGDRRRTPRGGCAARPCGTRGGGGRRPGAAPQRLHTVRGARRPHGIAARSARRKRDGHPHLARHRHHVARTHQRGHRERHGGGGRRGARAPRRQRTHHGTHVARSHGGRHAHRDRDGPAAGDRRTPVEPGAERQPPGGRRGAQLRFAA